MAKTESFPLRIWSGLITPEHHKKMGPAIWVFLWLVDKVTKEENRLGYVLGGKPVTYAEISEALEISVSAARHAMERLSIGGYIKTNRRSGGLTVVVLKSKKRLCKGAEKEQSLAENEQSDCSISNNQVSENEQSLSSHDMYKDSTEDMNRDKVKKAFMSIFEDIDALSPEEYESLSRETIDVMASQPFTRSLLVHTPDGYALPPDGKNRFTHRMMMRMTLAKRKRNV